MKSLQDKEARVLLAQHYRATPGVATGEGHDTIYTNGFFAAWREDRVAALTFHQMGDRDSYPGDYVGIAAAEKILSPDEVDAACVDFLEAWRNLSDDDRNAVFWSSALDTVIGIATPRAGRKTRAAEWVAINAELLRTYPHISPACREDFCEKLRPFLESAPAS